MRFLILFIVFCIFEKYCDAVADGKMEQVFAWNQIGYNIDGVKYTKDSIYERNPQHLHFPDEVEDKDVFFVQYDNVPIGFEVYEEKVFVTVPRRRYGIPCSLNYVNASSSSSPLLSPYPNSAACQSLISVYRPRVDVCGRLWMVDTGLLEVPGAREQIQLPSIVIFDLKTNEQILKYELKPTDLVNERTSGGLTSITVDVDQSSCEDAFAYITDLATEGLVVFSLKQRDSWRVDHASFKHDAALLNFTVAGFTIPWRDGLFSVALSDVEDGRRKAFYHPLVSAQEYSVYTDLLQSKAQVDAIVEGTRGPNPQVGSHAYHSATQVLLSANVANNAILCWNTLTPLTDEYSVIVAQDNEKLVYISDLKVVNDEVWVLVNQMPVFVFSKLNKETPNFFIHKAKIEDLIKNTKCDQNLDQRVGEKSL